MKTCVLFVLCIVASLSLTAQRYETREEFNGPFPSWANVKTRFRAAADGRRDDTRALQQALDSLTCTLKIPFNTNPATRYFVVYLPRGVYRITRTLRLEGKIGVSFIGEDPQHTIIRWDGPDDDTMFLSNRSAYVKFSRITWDANNKKNIEALGIHYKDFKEPFFAPTSMEVSDMIFTGNPAYGLSCGSIPSNGTGTMDSEFTIRRCKFYACAKAGLKIQGYNALDFWVWDCEFRNCYHGIDCEYGNYHAYYCHFYNTVTVDLYNKNCFYTSARGCYSSNAEFFSYDEGASCNAFKRVFQNNIIEECRNRPVLFNHQGKLTFTGNRFLNTKKQLDFTVQYASWCYGSYDILSINNNYQQQQPHELRKDYPSRIHSIQDNRLLANSTVKQTAPVPLQPFLPRVVRPVFEIPAQANTAMIQSVINKAATASGRAPVVHFPAGEYLIDRPIEIPAGSDMQLIGDGLLFASTLRRNGPKGKDFHYFIVRGPSYITVRDLTLGLDGNPDETNGFLFTGVDQQQSQVIVDQLYTHANVALLIDGLDYTYFEKNNSFFSKGNAVIGGPKVRAGTGSSRLYCFGGQSAGVRLENNALMVAKDCWWEGAFRKNYMPVDLRGHGNLTVDGAMYAPTDADSGTAINVDQFKGKLSLLNMYLIGSVDIKPGNKDLKAYLWNINFFHKKDPAYITRRKTNAKIAMMGISSQCFKSYDKTCSDENPRSLPDRLVNVPQLPTFIAEMTADTRNAMPKRSYERKEGVSDIYISRVSVSTGSTALTFRK